MHLFTKNKGEKIKQFEFCHLSHIDIFLKNLLDVWGSHDSPWLEEDLQT